MKCKSFVVRVWYKVYYIFYFGLGFFWEFFVKIAFLHKAACAVGSAVSCRCVSAGPPCSSGCIAALPSPPARVARAPLRKMRPGGPAKDRGWVGGAGAQGPWRSGHRMRFQVPARISEGSVRRCSPGRWPRCPAGGRAGGSLRRGRAAGAGSP